ncbi:MAG TPA: hypothetical protein VFW65_40650 [Pseudonocardiaceae bacterium]|nr:hypothetical protein [Pseudonocardiaceae bacterium]
MTLSENAATTVPPTDRAQPTTLHVNDAAFTVQRMIAEADRRGYTWHFMPKAAPAQEWRGVTGKTRRALIGVVWAARLAARARQHDIVQVHSASVLAHSRVSAPRFVLHCHGSDVRTLQYQQKWSSTIRDGLRDAEAVFYPTPELAEHVLPHRPDAVYVPIPVDVQNVAEWAPEPGKPRIFFASRWSADKNVTVQLAMARELMPAIGDRADVVGLDWGPEAPEAAALGIRLVPRCDQATYLRLIVGSRVVIGQSAGILATSELETLAAGAPLVLPVKLPLYADTAPPVYGGTVADAVAATLALLDGDQPHDLAATRKWTRDHHGIEHAVDTVARVHRDVMARR